MTEKNFCHMGNQTHDFGTNHLAHRSRMLYHYTKSLSLKVLVHWCIVANPPMCTCHELMIFFQQRVKIGAKATTVQPLFWHILHLFMVFFSHLTRLESLRAFTRMRNLYSAEHLASLKPGTNENWFGTNYFVSPKTIVIHRTKVIKLLKLGDLGLLD